MKVGRREFLKLAGSAAAGAIIPVKDKGKGIETPEEMTFEGIAQITNTGPIDRLDGEPCGPIPSDDKVIAGGGVISLEEYADRLGIWVSKWIPSTHDKDDCPACQAATQPEYDCDYYCPISQGGWVETWVNPATGLPVHTTLEWDDHGLHTTFRADDHCLSRVLSSQVDPSKYLHSIWVAGQVALQAILSQKVRS